jgi:outer membrane protein assembly factor BamB
MTRFTRAAVSVTCALVGVNVLHAQRGGNDWMTAGSDVQRSSWVRSDAKISPESMRKPGFELVWKFQVKNAPRQMNSITPPALLDFYIGYRGFRTLGFVGGSSGTVTAIDTDIARLEWNNKYDVKGAAGTPECPGGMTSGVTRPTNLGYPAMMAAGRGRGSAAKSGVGEPGEGAITLKEISSRPAPTPPPQAKQGRSRTAPPGNPFARTPLYVNAIAPDGKFHTMYVSNGEEPISPVQFLPANAHAQGLVVFDGSAYAATVNSCGGVDNGVWSMNLESKQVNHWKAPANIAGTAGPAATPDGTLYVAAGEEVVALDSATLKAKSSFKTGSPVTSSVVVFEHKEKDLVAVATAAGDIIVLDSALAVPVAKAAGVVKAGYATGALASWQDPSGTRWLLVPTGSAVAALKLVEQGGSLSLQSGWTSRDLVSPLPPMVINGVVFALSSGEARDAKALVAERVRKSQKAVLYALDGTTGKELWNSGSTIATFVSTGGLSAGGTRVYVGGHDGTLYAFGYPIEH